MIYYNLMAVIDNYFLNQVSVILGIIAMIACVYGNIPPAYAKVVLWSMPIMILTNYFALTWIPKK